MAITITSREMTDVRDMTAAIEAAAPGEGLWWVYAEHYVVVGREPPRDLELLVAELRRLRDERA